MDYMKDNKEVSFVLGTAGHIDHGKTALVKAMSGVNCDRLKEEQKRGMTIALGFAPLKLPSGKIISVVDMPGHEKFIRQMVSGATGIDAVMLVIAADDGVMPQTREHLEILKLLGVKQGVIVITKTDMVDDEIIELAKEDVSILVKGTFLESAPVVPVSSVNGTGVHLLLSYIDQLANSYVRDNINSKFFMPVDRVFKISGFGTVVTGTSMSGSINIGQTVKVLPSEKLAKIRSLQVHNMDVSCVNAGQRVAINLANISTDDIKYGSSICVPGFYNKTNCLNVELSVIKDSGISIKHWQRIKIHVGTSDMMCHVILLDRKILLPGESTYAQLQLDENIGVMSGSHFILRAGTPIQTVAGGKIVFAYGKRCKGKKEKKILLESITSLSNSTSEREYILELVNYLGIVTSNELECFMKRDLKDFRGSLVSLVMTHKIGVIKDGATNYISMSVLEMYRDKTISVVEKFHKERPELRGIAIERLMAFLSIDNLRRISALMSLFSEYKWVVFSGGKVANIDFVPINTGEVKENASRVISYLNDCGFSLPTINETEISLKLGHDELKRVITWLKENGDLDVINNGTMLFSKEQQGALLTILRGLGKVVSLGEVRDKTESTRKYVLPMLEFFDSQRITRRVGDKRILLD